MLVQLNEKEINVLKDVLREAEKVSEPRERIIATNDTIRDIVEREIKKYGNNADLNHIDVSRVTDMSYLFSMDDFNGDFSNITDMSYLFYMDDFNGDISNWNVSNVTDMEKMFCHSEFNGDISKWDVSNVTDMHRMFAGSKFNGDISKWNFNKAVDTTKLGYDFTDAELSELEL